ncbi:hypothetical protein JO379_005661 [Streptomyces syringium]|uniref:Uncharacterized protein n=1 Tax=Streptomyces syringium TaxID=76729 RepID=A0ABS4YBM4_9ACTN|nr:hypothetical protein [Streptomyces syringium]
MDIHPGTLTKRRPGQTASRRYACAPLRAVWRWGAGCEAAHGTQITYEPG